MKKFVKWFGICYIPCALFFVAVFGEWINYGPNLILILILWAPIPALIISGIIVGLTKITNVYSDEKCPRCGKERTSTDKFCPNCGYHYENERINSL